MSKRILKITLLLATFLCMGQQVHLHAQSFASTDVPYVTVSGTETFSTESPYKIEVVSQTFRVSGKVTSQEDGTPLPGVNILVMGTSTAIGTVTDIEGNYSINVPDENSTLKFSFIGYVDQEVPVNGRNVINVSLASDTKQLSEVVVVGYGTQRKEEITSSITRVSEEEFNKGNINDPTQLLQGKVAGLQVAKAGGNPNQPFSVRLRGLSTLGANAEPLVVIDGTIGGSLSTVDPNDIASIDVLKDASAGAIYGTRGSTGVIIVTCTNSTQSFQKGVSLCRLITSNSIARP